MSLNVQTLVINGVVWLRAQDVCDYLFTSAATVHAMCSDVAPEATKVVVDVLDVTRDFVAETMAKAVAE